MKSQFELRAVLKVFPQADETCTVFRDLSAVFNQGVSYAITGISGTGKSTLLSLLAGLERPTSGEVLFDGDNVADLGAHETRHFYHHAVGIVFQAPYVIRELSVLENVMLKGLVAGWSLADCRAKGLALLERVGLAHKAHVAPATLSIGEQQRVSILRALFCEPRFILADEPTAHLDVANRELVIDLLREYQTRLSMGLIVSCHDAYVAERMDVHIEIVQQQLVVRRQ